VPPLFDGSLFKDKKERNYRAAFGWREQLEFTGDWRSQGTCIDIWYDEDESTVRGAA
jgi:hypothetical protein